MRKAEFGLRKGRLAANDLDALADDFEFARRDGDLRRAVAQAAQAPADGVGGFAASFVA